LTSAVQSLMAERAQAAGEQAVKETLSNRLKGLIKKK
jgi:hypothetical protein